MANFTNCGSLFLKDTDFRVLPYGGAQVITDATAQSITGRVDASCGLAFDSLYFKKLSNCMSVVSDTNATATNVTISPCSGTLFNSDYFDMTGNVLSYGAGMNATITFDVTPTDATIALTDNLGNTVTVTNKVANVILGRTYHYTVSETGYESVAGGIVANSATHTETVVLTANP